MSAAPRARIEALRAQRVLFDAVFTVVWKALRPHSLSHAERQDLAQDVAIVAYRRRLSYRAERGNPRQWLSGIIRRELKRFLSMRQRRQPWLAEGDDLPDVPDRAFTPEEDVSRRDFIDHRLAMLGPEERRAVILVEVEELTLREVADRERISASTAYERHQRGMAALRIVEARA
jgi:RNA polymerase sigma factor (sigma-70 family)